MLQNVELMESFPKVKSYLLVYSTKSFHWSLKLWKGLKAYRKTDGSILLFRPEENAIRMISGAERMCMPAPTVEQFVIVVKQTVQANKRWVSPTSKGSLYIRPHLIGSGVVLGLAPAPDIALSFLYPLLGIISSETCKWQSCE